MAGRIGEGRRWPGTTACAAGLGMLLLAAGSAQAREPVAGYDEGREAALEWSERAHRPTREQREALADEAQRWLLDPEGAERLARERREAIAQREREEAARADAEALAAAEQERIRAAKQKAAAARLTEAVAVDDGNRSVAPPDVAAGPRLDAVEPEGTTRQVAPSDGLLSAWRRAWASEQARIAAWRQQPLPPAPDAGLARTDRPEPAGDTWLERWIRVAADALRPPAESVAAPGVEPAAPPEIASAAPEAPASRESARVATEADGELHPEHIAAEAGGELHPERIAADRVRTWSRVAALWVTAQRWFEEEPEGPEPLVAPVVVARAELAAQPPANAGAAASLEPAPRVATTTAPPVRTPLVAQPRPAAKVVLSRTAVATQTAALPRVDPTTRPAQIGDARQAAAPSRAKVARKPKPTPPKVAAKRTTTAGPGVAEAASASSRGPLPSAKRRPTQDRVAATQHRSTRGELVTKKQTRSERDRVDEKQSTAERTEIAQKPSAPAQERVVETQSTPERVQVARKPNAPTPERTARKRDATERDEVATRPSTPPRTTLAPRPSAAAESRVASQPTPAARPIPSRPGAPAAKMPSPRPAASAASRASEPSTRTQQAANGSRESTTRVTPLGESTDPRADRGAQKKKRMRHLPIAQTRPSRTAPPTRSRAERVATVRPPRVRDEPLDEWRLRSRRLAAAEIDRAHRIQTALARDDAMPPLRRAADVRPPPSVDAGPPLRRADRPRTTPVRRGGRSSRGHEHADGTFCEDDHGDVHVIEECDDLGCGLYEEVCDEAGCTHTEIELVRLDR